ncbi:MAG: LpxI family protein [Verrucomicrobiales bacterium]
MSVPTTLGLIAGSGQYPRIVLHAARRAGVVRVVVAAFEGETDPMLAAEADVTEWLRVGQLGKLLKFFRLSGVTDAIMAGQIAPKNLFDLRPDLRALVLLGKLKRRHAESIFGAIADEMARDGITLLPATTFLDDLLPASGHVCGPALNAKQLADADFGFRIAKEMSRLDIGQSVVVKRGTVLAVEAFEGTDECLKRGGALGKGGATLAKVSKPNQDFRFDVPVVGPRTIQTAAEAGIRVIAVEARRTLLLGLDEIRPLCERHRIGLVAVEAD